jgi:hypothetical protein
VTPRLWHVSSSLNRASIAEHGLDWGRMRVTGGIASGPGAGPPYQPELDAVFLCESLDDVEFFVGFGQHAHVDVWEVEGRGLDIQPGPDGWVMCRTAIGPARVRLLHADRTPEGRPLSTATLSFTSTRLSVDGMSALAGIDPDEAGQQDGEALEDLDPEAADFWWLIKGSDRYAPVVSQVEELMARIGAAETGLRRLAADADDGRFIARQDDRDAALSSETRALLERIGVAIGYP